MTSENKEEKKPYELKPLGRPPLSRQLQTHRAKQVAFNRAINKYINCTLKELRVYIQNEDHPIIEHLAIQTLIKGAETSDPRRIDAVLYTVVRGSKVKAKKDDKKVPAEELDLPSPEEFTDDDA